MRSTPSGGSRGGNSGSEPRGITAVEPSVMIRISKRATRPRAVRVGPSGQSETKGGDRGRCICLVSGSSGGQIDILGSWLIHRPCACHVFCCLVHEGGWGGWGWGVMTCLYRKEAVVRTSLCSYLYKFMICFYATSKYAVSPH